VLRGNLTVRFGKLRFKVPKTYKSLGSDGSAKMLVSYRLAWSTVYWIAAALLLLRIRVKFEGKKFEVHVALALRS